MASNIKKVFQPVSLLIGVGLMVFGIAFGGYAVSQQVIRIKAVLLGGVAVLAGIVVIFTLTIVDGCAACKKKLEEGFVRLDPQLQDQAKQAVLSKDMAQVLALVSQSPSPPLSQQQYACVVFEACPKCRSVARFKVSAFTHSPGKDSADETSLTEWQEVNSPQVAQVMDIAAQRTQQLYSQAGA